MNIRNILLLLLVLLPFSATAQKKIKVRNIQAIQRVEANITPNQAVDMALQEAKREAIRRAGIPEKVWSILGQITDSKNTKLIETYSEMSAITLNGLVAITSQDVQNIWEEETQTLIKKVTIDAEIIEEQEPDASFGIEVKGMEQIYQEGDKLSFDVHIHNRDAYIKIFWFNSQEGMMVFPIANNENKLFKANSTQVFPREGVSYKLIKRDKGVEQEEVNIVIVATKENLPFIGDVSFESVIRWIYKIPASKRVSHHSRFIIM